MVITFTRERLEMLHIMLCDLMQRFPATTEEEMALDIHVLSINTKMHYQLSTYKVKNNYPIYFTKEEALAFDKWMEELNLTLLKLEYYQERMYAKQITNQIDETYGTIGIRKTDTAVEPNIK